MDSQQSGNSLLPVATLLLAAVLGGSYLIDAPFKLFRSPQSKIRMLHGDDLEDVAARLWQDPLAVAHDALRGSKKEQGVELLARQIATNLRDNRQLLMLPVAVPGSPYAEGAEHRRRIRHAVLAGLAAQKQEPLRPEHIGYFNFTFPEEWSQYKRSRALVPFEWFRFNSHSETHAHDEDDFWNDPAQLGINPADERWEVIDAFYKLPEHLKETLKNGGFESFLVEQFRDNLEDTRAPVDVLVLWLNEEQFQSYGELAHLMGHLLGFRLPRDLVSNIGKAPFSSKQAGLTAKDINRLVSITFLGPFGSSTLKAYLDETESQQLQTPQATVIGKPDMDVGVLAQDLLKRLGALSNDSPLPSQLKGSIVEQLDLFYRHQTETSFRGDMERLRNALVPLVARESGIDLTLVGTEVETWIAENKKYFEGSTLAELFPCPPIRLFTSYATASPTSLIPKVFFGSDSSAEDLVTALESTSFDKFASFNVHDDALAEAIMDELRLRGDVFSSIRNPLKEWVSKIKQKKESRQQEKKSSSETKKTSASDVADDSPSEEEGPAPEEAYQSVERFPGTMVLIGEWDTFYARSLVKTMEESARKRLGLRPQNIRRIHYLRGLDGVIPGMAGEEKTMESPAVDNPKQSNGVKNLTAGDLEQPVDRSQLDYVRRIAISLVNWNRTKDWQEKIRYIGVLGSDVYDKQLILQALRPQFPEVVFFTTDLDARLFHPGQYDWARNLIIASGFGLELKEELQAGQPPFRDSYQTATFFATQLALRTKGKPLFRAQPLIFEVARSGAYQLTPSPAMAMVSENVSGLAPYIHPKKKEPSFTVFLSHKAGFFFPLLLLIIWQVSTFLFGFWSKVSNRFAGFKTKVKLVRKTGLRALLKQVLVGIWDPIIKGIGAFFRALRPQKMIAFYLRVGRSQLVEDWITPIFVLLRCVLFVLLWALVLIAFYDDSTISGGLLPFHSWVGGTFLTIYAMRHFASGHRARTPLRFLNLHMVILSVVGVFYIDFVVDRIFEGGDGAMLVTTLLFALLAIFTPTLPGLFQRLLGWIIRMGSIFLWFVIFAWLLDLYLSNGLDLVYIVFAIAVLLTQFLLRQCFSSLARAFDYGLPASLILLIIAVVDHVENEPFELFEGISIWPTIFISWAALATGILLAVLGLRKMKRNSETIDQLYFDCGDSGSQPRSSAVHVWRDYRHLWRIKTSIAWALVLSLGFIGGIALEHYPKLGRGTIANSIEGILFFLNGTLLIYLTMFAMEQTRTCVAFMKRLAEKDDLTWPEHDRARVRKELALEQGIPVDDRYLDDYLDLKLIVRRTRPVSNLIFYPFVMVFFILVSYHNYFDNWHLPFFVFLFFGSLCCYGLGCGYYLRREAEKARKAALGQIRKKLAECGESERHPAVRVIIDKIGSIADGALAPWNRHPILHSILLPLGGLSTLAVAEFLLMLVR